MKQKRRKLLYILNILIIFFGIQLYPVQSFAEEKEIDIEVMPEDKLFNIDNMKPGDWAPRELTVINQGTKKFIYQMKVENQGPEKLFNELIIEISDSNGELYNGKLAAFSGLDNRELAPSTQETLQITIRFPEHLGNEFQGVNSQFKFIFIAEETDETGGEDPGEGDEGENPGEGDGGEDSDEDKGGEDADNDEGKEDVIDNDRDEEEIGGNVGSGGSTDAGSVLPDTATNIYLFLFGGFLLTVTGGLIFFINRKLKSYK